MYLSSPIGDLLLIANESSLLEIQFAKKTEKLTGSPNKVLKQAKKELELYFGGKLKSFTVPLTLNGTDFQKRCWKNLIKLPYGKTISYKEQAIKVGGANYSRAVAGANNKNKLPIIIPCHRVIGSNGSLVGYAGGLRAKKILLSLEEECRG